MLLGLSCRLAGREVYIFHMSTVPSIAFLADLSSVFAQAAAGSGDPAPPSPGGMLVPMVAVFVIMYFLVIRPQNKRQKQLQEMVSNLKTGDRVVTNGGIHGQVANVKDGQTLVLKIADSVKIEVEKSAIATILKDSKEGSSAS
jgi:preprotein translocase subunit YajC